LFLVLLNLQQTQAFKAQQELHQQAMQAEQARLQSEVTNRTAQLVELNDHLQTAREDERHRIARDLHDEMGALLTSAKLDVARIKSRLGTTAPEASERLAHLVDTLNAGIAMKRRIIEDLWPSTLNHLGLVATLDILAREFSKSIGIPVHCTLQPVALDPTTQLVVYRLVQEATTNIAKYAQARTVWVSLACKDNQIEVCVRDDGIGFDTGKISSKSHGLLGMRLRVEAEQGVLELVSSPGQGTSIRARWPESPSVPV
jgi:signal transduction histidine kinase